ncbi:MAG: TIGR00153 family protein [Euryarchaeota archaeon]|nr:TIGR00153 family protein [Euryarchaeota archaeon]
MKYVRAPIIETLRKSPFEALVEHAGIVKKSAQLLREEMNAYLDGRFEEFEKLKKEVEELELKADYIKSNIRNHLPKSVKMPVDRSVFLSLLGEVDKVEDLIQDIGEWISMREKPIPDELRGEFRKLFDKAMESVEACECAVMQLNTVIEASFAEPERKRAKELIQRLHEVEHESDIIERELTRKIFGMEDRISPVAIFHLSKLVFLLGDIANHAENAGDRIRALLAR